ncbi:MAG: NAD-dependent epimerase/dehydratase family protein [Acidobacteria bacterium]|nr:NAD-dependent epimerase/dehydratase family protein [Acidobacteriota bacterium]
MKILVTGGAGFIGSHLVDHLIDLGHEVVVVDDLSFGRRENINPKAKFYQIDIRSPELGEILKKEHPDIVNHHAAQVNLRRSMEEPLFDAEVNAVGSLNLIHQSAEAGVSKLIYSSTGGALYGEPKVIPATEDHPIAPLSLYGVHKYIVEHYLRLYSTSHNLRYTVLRYGNVYGPRQNPKGEAGVVAIFSLKMLRGERPVIFGDGSKTRDYVYIEDVVRANILALEGGDNEVFNVGTGLEVTDQEIFDKVREKVGCDIEPIYGEKRPGEIDHIALAYTKIKKTLGWEPKVSLDEGVSRAVSYYRENIDLF